MSVMRVLKVFAACCLLTVAAVAAGEKPTERLLIRGDRAGIKGVEEYLLERTDAGLHLHQGGGAVDGSRIWTRWDCRP